MVNVHDIYGNNVAQFLMHIYDMHIIEFLAGHLANGEYKLTDYEERFTRHFTIANHSITVLFERVRF
jgi:hypothetical protein